MIPLRYSEARGKLIYEKNLKSKISCQTPFKLFTQFYQNLFSAVRGLKLLSEACLYHLNQCCGSGFDPDSMGSLDPFPDPGYFEVLDFLF